MSDAYTVPPPVRGEGGYSAANGLSRCHCRGWMSSKT